MQFETIYLDMSTVRAYASELGDARCVLDGWLIASQRILSTETGCIAMFTRGRRWTYSKPV